MDIVYFDFVNVIGKRRVRVEELYTRAEINSRRIWKRLHVTMVAIKPNSRWFAW